VQEKAERSVQQGEKERFPIRDGDHSEIGSKVVNDDRMASSPRVRNKTLMRRYEESKI
jgi:hypothetical protein